MRVAELLLDLLKFVVLVFSLTSLGLSIIDLDLAELSSVVVLIRLVRFKSSATLAKLV